MTHRERQGEGNKARITTNIKQLYAASTQNKMLPHPAAGPVCQVRVG